LNYHGSTIKTSIHCCESEDSWMANACFSFVYITLEKVRRYMTMLGYEILGFVIFVIVLIAYGFFMEKKFGPDISNKSEDQTMNE